MLYAAILAYFVLSVLVSVGYWKNFTKPQEFGRRFAVGALFFTVFVPLCGLYWLASVAIALVFIVLIRSERALRALLYRVSGKGATPQQAAVKRTRQQLRKMSRQSEKNLRRAGRAA